MSPSKRDKKHNGVDFYIKAGDQILAANDGNVVYAKHDKCAGNVMTIKHTGSIYASYLHIGEFKVKKGDIIFIPPAEITKWNRTISLLLPQTNLFSSYTPVIKNGLEVYE